MPSADIQTGGSVTYTYTATIKGTFSGGNGTCGPGKFPVINLVTITGGSSDTVTVCLNAPPNLNPLKTTDNHTPSLHDALPISIKISNTGTATATAIAASDDYDEAHAD